MQRYRVSTSPQAEADIQLLHDYIAADSPKNAARMVDRILEAIQSLKLFPHRTVVRPQRSVWPHRVRSLVVKPYVIFFWIVEKEKLVYVLMIRHGARRRPKHFQ
jgi:plasmid stabilization system protein ParE